MIYEANGAFSQQDLFYMMFASNEGSDQPVFFVEVSSTEETSVVSVLWNRHRLNYMFISLTVKTGHFVTGIQLKVSSDIFQREIIFGNLSSFPTV